MMEKKKFTSRAALILSNALGNNRQQRVTSETSGKENENGSRWSSSCHRRRNNRCKAKRRLFADRKFKYLTSTPKVIRKVGDMFKCFDFFHIFVITVWLFLLFWYRWKILLWFVFMSYVTTSSFSSQC